MHLILSMFRFSLLVAIVVCFVIIAEIIAVQHCTVESGCVHPYNVAGETEPKMFSMNIHGLKKTYWDAERSATNNFMPRNSIAGNAQVNCVNGVAGGYPCKDIDMLAYVSLNDLGCTNANGNDIWGWTDANQNEYVIAGCESGTSFVDVTDPVSPVVLGFLPTQSASSNWRDMKVYNGHAYIGSEAGGHGIQVMDLSQLSTLSAAYRANPTGQLNWVTPLRQLLFILKFPVLIML